MSNYSDWTDEQLVAAYKAECHWEGDEDKIRAILAELTTRPFFTPWIEGMKDEQLRKAK